MEDDVFASIGSSPSLLDLVLIPDSLNVRGEWEEVVLGPYKKVLVSGSRDGKDWGGVRVIWDGDGSL
jgi:hypothetical protein